MDPLTEPGDQPDRGAVLIRSTDVPLLDDVLCYGWHTAEAASAYAAGHAERAAAESRNAVAVFARIMARCGAL